MYIGPTLTDLKPSLLNQVMMRESLINSVKKDVENHRTLFDRFVDFFMSKNSVVSKYAARTEETMHRFLKNIETGCGNAVITKLEGNEWKVSFSGSDNQISYITTREPKTGKIAADLYRTMIQTGKVLPPDAHPETGPAEGSFPVQGTVYGWDSPYGVNLRETCIKEQNMQGEAEYMYDDGVNCYCPLTFHYDSLKEIITHCLKSGLSPVESEIIKHGNGKVDIGVRSDHHRGEDADSGAMCISLKKDRPPRLTLKANNMNITGLIDRVRPQNVNVELLTEYTNGTDLHNMLSSVSEPFCHCAKHEAAEEILYILIFDIGNGCTVISPYSVQKNDDTRALDVLLARKSENFTDTLIKQALEAEQIFDENIDTQIESFVGLWNTERTMNAVLQRQNAQTRVTLTDPLGEESVTFTVAARISTAGEGRGRVLINALLNASEEATTADGATMYKNISTIRLRQSLVNAINNCERRKLQS